MALVGQSLTKQPMQEKPFTAPHRNKGNLKDN